MKGSNGYARAVTARAVMAILKQHLLQDDLENAQIKINLFITLRKFVDIIRKPDISILEVKMRKHDLLYSTNKKNITLKRRHFSSEKQHTIEIHTMLVKPGLHIGLLLFLKYRHTDGHRHRFKEIAWLLRLILPCSYWSPDLVQH